MIRSTKICTKCGKKKPLDGFHKSKRDGVVSFCKPCVAARQREGRPPPKKCACGCGETFRPSSKRSRYIIRHWGRGRTHSESHRKKMSETAQRIGRSEKQLEQLGKVHSKVRERINRMSKVERDKLTIHCHAVIKGKHGFGRTARDNPNHCQAKTWLIQSPEGKRYGFSNLRSWCRKNERLFENLHPEAKSPTWMRAYNGLSADGTWNNWRVIECKK